MAAAKWNVDFSLALFNRSGKYQIGRALLDSHAELFHRIYYWRMGSRHTPTGLVARIIGKAEAVEHGVRTGRHCSALRAGRGGRPWLHLDPLTALHRRTEPNDLILCHDLGPLTHPELFAPGVERAYRFAYERIAAEGARLVFVSRDTQTRYQRLFGLPSRSTVIYPPIEKRVVDGDETPVDGIGARFLLTVGAVGRRKNQATCVRAFAASELAAQGVQYICCGSREPGFEEVELLATQTPGVMLLPFVSDSQLRWLYRHASGFVLMSRLEGFGMPAGEALAHGLVPLVSHDSVLGEVTGPSGLSAPAEDCGAIAAQMTRLATLGATERGVLTRRMPEQLARFSVGAFHAAWAEQLGATASIGAN